MNRIGSFNKDIIDLKRAQGNAILQQNLNKLPSTLQTQTSPSHSRKKEIVHIPGQIELYKKIEVVPTVQNPKNLAAASLKITPLK